MSIATVHHEPLPYTASSTPSSHGRRRPLTVAVVELRRDLRELLSLSPSPLSVSPLPHVILLADVIGLSKRSPSEKTKPANGPHSTVPLAAVFSPSSTPPYARQSPLTPLSSSGENPHAVVETTSVTVTVIVASSVLPLRRRAFFFFGVPSLVFAPL